MASVGDLVLLSSSIVSTADSALLLRNAIVVTAMGFLACLHYAFRAVLLFFGRLRMFRLVKAQSAIVCLHVVEIRVSFTSPRLASNRRLCAIILRVRTPSTLIARMKPSAVARCAIANELLRRRKQTVCDNTTRPRPDHLNQVELMSVTFEETPADIAHIDSPQLLTERHAQSLITSTPRQAGSAETTGVQLNTSDTIGTRASESPRVVQRAYNTGTESHTNTRLPIVHRRKSSVWKPILTRDRSSSAVLTALQLNAERSTMTASADVESTEINESSRQDPQDQLNAPLETPRPAVRQQQREDHTLTSFRFPQFQHPSGPEAAALEPFPDASGDSASPTSDTTLFEESVVYSLDQLKGGQGFGNHSAYDGTVRDQTYAVQALQTKEKAATSGPRRRTRHQRYASTDSAFSAVGTPSIPLRSRAKTNDGLLIFKANTTRDPMAPPPKPTGHRRKVSLNLPVNAPTPRPEGLRLPKRPNYESWTESPNRAKVENNITMINILTPEERDLEYMHRHTYIGTGSLDDFLEVLEMSPSHTTTKAAVARAFVQIASTEQLYARQCSTRPDGWELVSRTTLDVMDVTSVDYVVQLQVKLGSITLRQFLDMTPFDEDDEVAVMAVVETFCAASHVDAKVGTGAASKGRAFRSWMVTQKTGSGC